MEYLLLALPPAPEKPEAPGGGFSPFLIVIVLLFAMMLFMPLLSKKERHRTKRLQGLKKYDRVVTSGGMFGTVISFDDLTVTLEVAKGVRLSFKRSSIYDIEKEGAGAPDETSEKQAGAKS
jgi:preprotein translocase subunit YajC